MRGSSRCWRRDHRRRPMGSRAAREEGRKDRPEERRHFRQLQLDHRSLPAPTKPRPPLNHRHLPLRRHLQLPPKHPARRNQLHHRLRPTQRRPPLPRRRTAMTRENCHRHTLVSAARAQDQRTGTEDGGRMCAYCSEYTHEICFEECAQGQNTWLMSPWLFPVLHSVIDWPSLATTSTSTAWDASFGGVDHTQETSSQWPG